MGIKVAGIWELSWNTPLNESWLWSFPLREFQVAEWAMTPITGITHMDKWNSNGIKFTEYESVEAMMAEFPGDYTRVYIDDKGAIPLQDFTHPENAIYIFGNVGNSALPYKREEDFSVVVPTVINTGTAWPHQCLMAVLYDRLVKAS